MNTPYPGNLTDDEWECLQRFLPPRSPHGMLRRHHLRSIFDALFYLLRTGCPWRYLPSDFPRLPNRLLSLQAVLSHRPLDASLEGRSEEHTSELQLQSNLVCRLLLEKKKKKKIPLLIVKKKKKKLMPNI